MKNLFGYLLCTLLWTPFAFGWEDAKLCDYLKEQSVVFQHFPKPLKYLCENNGLEQLRQHGFVDIEDIKDGNTSSYTYATHLESASPLSAGKKIFRLFCQDFESFRTIAPDAWKDVKAITTWNTSLSGCDMHFEGKKILFWKPEFKGKVAFVENEPSVFISATYHTEPISLVNDSQQLVVGVQVPGAIHLYSVAHYEAETKGFHNKVKDQLILSAQQLAEGVESHLPDFE